MADVVENRVVEMSFENKDFETNISKSLKSIDNLNKALEFKGSTKGFEEIQNAISKLDFSSITNATKNIEESFTTLAGTLQREFFDAISSKIVSLGTQLANSTFGQIISGGKSRAMNIEQAQFKVKGLGGNWSELYEDMDYAVSGTAYGIDAAANAASQFLASSVKTGDDMKSALRAISGIAAMTSSDYSSIANIFTAAAGKGRVQAMELNRISLRGVNAAAALGEYLGKTEAQVRDMASKGQIDFQTFANAMDSAFGEHAKKANETFTGSFSNMKAALSRIGEIWYEPWIRSMIPVFNSLKEKIDEVKNWLKTPMDAEGNTIATALKATMDAASNAFVKFTDTWELFIQALPFQLEDTFDSLQKLEGFFNFLTDALDTLSSFMKEDMHKYDFFDVIYDEVDRTGEGVEVAEERVKDLRDYLENEALGTAEKVKDSVKDVSKATDDSAKDMSSLAKWALSQAQKTAQNSVEATEDAAEMARAVIQNEAEQIGLSAEWVEAEVAKATEQITKGTYEAGSVAEWAVKNCKKTEKAVKAVTDSVEELSDEEKTYWEAYYKRQAFNNPGMNLKDYYNTYLNITNDVADIVSKLGDHNVALSKTTASSIAEALDNYKTVWDTQHTTLKNSMNLYSEWSAKYSLTFKTLKKNLESNKTGLTQLAKDMQTLTKKGVSKELLDELKSQGASGAETVHALAKASKGELKQYEKTRKEIADLQKSTTDEWTKEEKTKYEETISKLVGFSGVTIEEAKEMYNGIFKDMGIENATSYSAGVSSVYGTIENTISTLESTMDKYKKYVTNDSSASDNAEEATDAAEETTEATEDTRTALEKLKDFGDKYGMSGVVNGLDSLYQAFLQVTYIVNDIFVKLKEFFGLAIDGFIDVVSTFNPNITSIATLLEWIDECIRNINLSGKNAELIRATFRGFFSVFELGRYILEKLAAFIGNTFMPKLYDMAGGTNPILKLTGAIGEFIYELVQVIENGGSISDILENLGNSFRDIWANIRSLLSTNNADGSGLSDFLWGVVDTIKTVISTILNTVFGTNIESNGKFGLFSKIFNFLFGDEDGGGLLGTLGSIIKYISKSIESGTGIIAGILKTVSNFIDLIADVIGGQKDNVSRFLDDIFTLVHRIFDALSNEEDGGVETVKNLFNTILGTIQTIFETVSTVVQSLQEPMTTIASAIATIADSVALLFQSISQWVADDPMHAYGAAAFFMLMYVILEGMKLLKDKKAPFDSLSKFFKGFSDAINQGFTIKETFFDKLVKVASAIFLIGAALAAIVWAMSKAGDKGILYVVVAAGVIIGMIAAMVWMMKKLQKLVLGAQGFNVKDWKVSFGMFVLVINSMSSMVLKMAASFAILLLAINKVDNRTVILAGIVLVGILVGMYILLKEVSDIGKGLRMIGPTGAKALKAVAAIVLMVGVSVSIMSLAFAGLVAEFALIFYLLGADAENVIFDAIACFAVIFGLLIAFMKAGLTKDMEKMKAGPLIAIAILMGVVGLVMHGIMIDLAYLAAISAANQKGLITAGIIVGVLLAILTGMMAAIMALSRGLRGGSALAILAVGVMASLIGATMFEMMAALAMISTLNIDQTTVDLYVNILTWLAIGLLVIVGAFAALAVYGGKSGLSEKIMYGIAAGLFAIGSMMKNLAKAFQTFISTFVMLATVWPTIKDKIPEMLSDLKDQLPAFLDLVKEVILKFSKMIIVCAPVIAAAITVLVTTIVTMFMQKIPIYVASFIIVCNEVLDLIIIGLGTILPKLLIIFFQITSFLSANGNIIGYELATVLLEILGGVAEAIWDFLIDVTEPWSDSFSNWLLWAHDCIKTFIWNVKELMKGAISELQQNTEYIYDGFVYSYYVLKGVLTQAMTPEEARRWAAGKSLYVDENGNIDQSKVDQYGNYSSSGDGVEFLSFKKYNSDKDYSAAIEESMEDRLNEQYGLTEKDKKTLKVIDKAATAIEVGTAVIATGGAAGAAAGAAGAGAGTAAAIGTAAKVGAGVGAYAASTVGDEYSTYKFKDSKSTTIGEANTKSKEAGEKATEAIEEKKQEFSDAYEGAKEGVTSLLTPVLSKFGISIGNEDNTDNAKEAGKEAGEADGKAYADGYIEKLQSEVNEDTIFSAVNDNFDYKNIASNVNGMLSSGTTNIDTTGAIEQLGTVMESVTSGDATAMVDTEIIPDYNVSDDYDPSTYLSEQTGYDAATDVDLADSGIQWTNDDISVDNTTLNNMTNAISILSDKINALTERFDNTIVMPQDTDINISTTMDGTVVATNVYPVIRSFSKEDDALEAEGLAAPSRSANYGSAEFSKTLRTKK